MYWIQRELQTHHRRSQTAEEEKMYFWHGRRWSSLYQQLVIRDYFNIPVSHVLANIPVSHVLAKGTPQHRTGREQSYSQNYKAIMRSMYVGRPSYQKQFWMATGLGWQGLRTWSYSATNFIPGAFRLLALLVTLHLLLVGATVGTGVVHGFQCTSFLCKALAEGAVQDVSPSTLCVAAVEQYVCCSSLWGWRTAFPYIIIWLTKPCMDKYH